MVSDVAGGARKKHSKAGFIFLVGDFINLYLCRYRQ